MSDVEKSELIDEEYLGKASKTNNDYGRYKDSQSSAEDNKSSGWILLCVGMLGIIVMVLGILDVIPFRFGNPYLFYGVLSAIFILFIVMGGVSFANAKKYESKAKSENSVRQSLIDWANKNLSAEGIDSEIENAGTEKEEILYFKRTKLISEKFNRQFVNVNPLLLESVIENVVYDMLYGEAEDYAEEDIDEYSEEYSEEDSDEGSDSYKKADE